MSQELTIFDIGLAERQKAMDVFLSGDTPREFIRKRPGRGGSTQEYVSTYYMTRLFNLITGFQWTSECLEEKYRPDATKPIEIMVKMKVTTWNKSNQPISHTAWGTKDVVYTKQGKIIALGDDLKAAYSDGIKKCLSYFGIADDVYGGKEAEVYVEEEAIEEKKSGTAVVSLEEVS
jgi:recombination DNA repair RAD52 pathway protein